MSSEAVRSAVYAAWPTVTPTLRLVRLINRTLPRNPPLPLPDSWGSVEFEMLQRAHVTMGNPAWVEEQGIVRLIVAARSGHGDLPGVQAAGAVADAWHDWMDPTGSIWFQRVGQAQEPAEQPDGDWFLVVIPCEYRHQIRA